MLAFSIQQPFAWLIVHGHKDIENRDWKPTNLGLRFRGPVLIHAGKRMYDGYEDAQDWSWPDIDPPGDFDLGGIVGEVEIVDCVTSSRSRWFNGPYGFVIHNPRPLPFRPCVGALGFFEPNYSKQYAVKRPKPPKPALVASSSPQRDLF